MKTNSKRLLAMMLSLIMIVGLVFSMSVSAFATSPEEQANSKLYNGVYTAVSNNDYALEAGGTIKGSKLLDAKTGEIDSTEFDKLSQKGKQNLISDINTKAEELATTSGSGVSQTTVDNWYRKLQNTNGVGEQFMSVILENTKPDFAGANRIYAPFSGVVGVIIGLIAVIMMSLLGVVMVADIAYIALPPLQAMAPPSDGVSGGDGKTNKASILFSQDAKFAVQESNQGENGTRKQAYGIYLKRRIPMLILLGICLLYLVSGNIFKLVSMILTLLHGFLGF